MSGDTTMQPVFLQVTPYCSSRNSYAAFFKESVLLLFLSAFPFEKSPQQVNCLHLTQSSPSSSLTHTTFMSSFTLSIHLLIWSSSRPPAWQFQTQHLSTDLLTVPPLYMSRPSQPGLCCFSNTSNVSCPSDVLISDSINPCHSQREPQHLHLCYLQLCLQSLPQCHSL
ncbi:hypothetical protein GOODEAATRI_007697 [Goodea atripinnis]|uniref:Uncharacterized protein n=1 Tax=Goodea atripinnis TaxID=208336 RepID=A0ABV0NSM3_9TELE